jgi:uncharacterized protein YecE (DUF72 family)
MIPMAARILSGTCSWTDPTLIACGRFYPPGVKSAEARLRYYADHFDLVEVDSKNYSPPSEGNSRLWVERTPPGFTFDVKAFALLTHHPARSDRLPAALRAFLRPDAPAAKNIYLHHLMSQGVDLLWQMHERALAPLHEAGKLGAVLFQFPPWFHKNDETIAYLAELRERLPHYRLAVEFRGGGWLLDDEVVDTLKLLRQAELAYVAVDEPQGFANSTPPLAVATSETAYVRLHGRNSLTWDRATAAASERFNYLYSDAELQEWVPRLHELAQTSQLLHVLFNNNYEDVGVRNARQMAALLGSGAVRPYPDLAGSGPPPDFAGGGPLRPSQADLFAGDDEIP